MPNRTTRDYEGPTIAPKIQAALDAALQDEEDIDVDGRFVVNIQIQILLFHIHVDGRLIALPVKYCSSDVIFEGLIFFLNLTYT